MEEESKLKERVILLMRLYWGEDLHMIGSELNIADIKELKSYWDLEPYKASLAISRQITDDELSKILNRHPPKYITLGGFQGQFYTVTEKGKMSLTSSWDRVRENVRKALSTFGDRGYGVLQALLNRRGESDYFTLIDEIEKVLGYEFVPSYVLPRLTPMKLIFKTGSNKYPTWTIPTEIIPVVEEELSRHKVGSEPQITKGSITKDRKTDNKALSSIEDQDEEKDVFIAHASEDKGSFVRPFAERLRSMGLKVWYDEFELRWGSKLLRSINRGIKNSKYGIVVLSRAFFGKPWPEAELAAMYNMMISSERDTLLPLRYGISHKELVDRAPLLSDIVNRSSDVGIEVLAQEVYNLVTREQSRTDLDPRARKMRDGPIVQIVNFGIEPPTSRNADSTKYHPNLRNDGSIPVSNIRIYFKMMDRVVNLSDIIKLKKQIRTNSIIYEGSILPGGSARVDSVDLPRTENETSSIFWLDYDFGDNESSGIVFDVRFKNFENTEVITYDHSILAKAEGA